MVSKSVLQYTKGVGWNPIGKIKNNISTKSLTRTLLGWMFVSSNILTIVILMHIYNNHIIAI